MLYENGVLITKTVWVYPPRDEPSSGDSLQNPEYLKFIQDIQAKGFEIGLHNVGSGDYTRDEILEGLEEYREKLGGYPDIHINHSYNKDSIYGGHKRFNFPFNKIVKMLYPQYAKNFEGEIRKSQYFWGDEHKKIIKFSRNHEFGGINTLKYDPRTPYIDPKRSEFCNLWFSSTFAPNQWVFNELINETTIDQLERENGTCIVFTHLGYFMRDGQIDPGFKSTIEYLGRKKGNYKPVSDVLNDIIEKRVTEGKPRAPKLRSLVKARMELQHLMTRVKFRWMTKLDDYAFKDLKKEMFDEKD